MKKLLFLLIFFVLAVLPSNVAQAFDGRGIYISPRVMYSHQTAAATGSGSAWGSMPDIFIHTEGLLDDHARKGTIGGGIALGYDFYPASEVPVRIELEAATRGKAEYVDWSVDTPEVAGSISAGIAATSVFTNIYYDFHNSSIVTPYIGGGVGLARLDAGIRVDRSYSGETVSYDWNKSKWNFAWNLGSGLSFRLAERAALDLGYRYVDFGDISTSMKVGASEAGASGSLKTKVTAHEVYLGFRMSNL